jgi:hypothetical protein
MSKQGESELSLKIRRALLARGHRVWKNWGSRFSERGLPDLTGVAADGRAIILETKMPGEEISGLKPAQYLFLRDCMRRAPLAIVGVVSSVAQAIRFVEDDRLRSHDTGKMVTMVEWGELTPDELSRFDRAAKRLFGS